MMRFARGAGLFVRAVASTAAVSCLALAFGCGDDDAAPTGPDGTLNDAVEISSGVAIATVISLSALANDVPGLGDGGRAFKVGRAPGPLAHAWDALRVRATNGPRANRTSAALLDSCADGGTTTETCTVMEGVSFAQATFAECREFDEKTSTTTTLNGALEATVTDPGFCDTGDVPDGADAMVGLDNFSATVRDLEGVTIERTAADLTVSVDASGLGCAGANSMLTLDGTLSIFSVPEGVDATLVADALTMAASSSGTPCVASLLVDGSLTLVDRVTNRHFTQAFDELVLTFAEKPNDRVEVTIDGAGTVDCLGLVSFSTIEPIFFVGDASCPAAGLIQVGLPGGSTSRIRFTASGGIEFDYDADGDVDRSVASCDDESIERCPS